MCLKYPCDPHQYQHQNRFLYGTERFICTTEWTINGESDLCRQTLPGTFHVYSSFCGADKPFGTIQMPILMLMLKQMISTSGITSKHVLWMATCPEWRHDILCTFQFSRWRRRDHAGSRDLKTDRIHDLIDVLNSQHNVDLLKTPDCDLWCSPVKITFTWDFMRWRSRKSGSRNMNEKVNGVFP